MITRVARAVGIALVVAALAGCSDGGTDDGPGPEGVASPTPDAEPTPGLPELPEPGPLEAYLGFADQSLSPAGLVSQLTRVESSVAACMSEQGFEYTPTVPAVGDVTATDGPLPGTRVFVEEYGYGVWSGPAETGGGLSWSIPADPNLARRQTMSEAEGEAYDTALRGPVTATGDDGSVLREGGCYDVAQGWAVADDAYLDGVRDDAQGFLDTIGDDSRFGEVDAAWASCMADAGFSYRTPAAAQQDFADEVTAETADGVLDPDLVAEHAPEEIRVAVADLDCQEATDWVARHRVIDIAIQQEYVDAHLADLEALAAALAGPTG